jgi:hypothetical protein
VATAFGGSGNIEAVTEGAAAGDHLARLFLTGDGSAWGSYSPERFEVVAGGDGSSSRVVHLHEAHHAALNDSTAWGSALHLLARLPEPYQCAFTWVLDACRLTQESFATFASVSLLASRGEDAAALLEPYPAYAPLHDSVLGVVSRVAGPNRRYLLATVAARAAMQTPVLDLFTEHGLDDLRPASLRHMDTPDARWIWLLRRGHAWWGTVGSEADDAVRQVHGDAALAADAMGDDPLAAVAEEHDASWASWEMAAYEVMRAALGRTSASVLGFNGHQRPTAAAVEVARSVDPGIGVQTAPALNAARDDRALAAAVVEQARHVFGGDTGRWPARLTGLDPPTLVDVVDQTSRIGDRPFLVVSARLPTRLRSLFRWSARDDETLAASRTPVVAVRFLEEDESAGMVVHADVPDPGFLLTMREQWADRGPFVCCVGASCLIDREWQRRWMAALLSVGRVAVLIDIELDRFVTSWTRDGTEVHAALIEIKDTAGPRRGVGISAGDPRLLWIAIGDELGTSLLMQQLRGTPDLRFDGGADHLQAWQEVLPALVTHLLATESFFDLEGLEGYL